MAETQTPAEKALAAAQTAQEASTEAPAETAESGAESGAQGAESTPHQEEDAQGQQAEQEQREQEAQRALDELPEWAQKEIADLRKENASTRIKKNEVAEQNKTLSQQLEEIRAAGDPAEQARLIEELQATARANELAATRERLARVNNLPEGADVLLTAGDPETLEAQAKAIAALYAGRQAAPVPQPDPVPPAGGREPYAEPTPSPSDLLAQARARR